MNIQLTKSGRNFYIIEADGVRYTWNVGHGWLIPNVDAEWNITTPTNEEYKAIVAYVKAYQRLTQHERD